MDGMLLLWSASFSVSILTLILAIVKRSWLYMLLSTITFLPVAYYFSGAINAWKYIGLTPIFFLILTILFWFLSRKNIED
ncbi:hypothetical protein ACFVT8_18600 [Lysinibacillus sp. NPDC058147]|uniref:hypothetical protein n=1 Tax=unclassified Lysinibacillus TaxID=2636778 RepID=UPI0036DA33A3